MIDWAGGAVFGVTATAALASVLMTAEMAGWTRLDLRLVLGAAFVADQDPARIVGVRVRGAADASALRPDDVPERCGDVCHAVEGRQVVLAQGVEGDVPSEGQLVLARPPVVGDPDCAGGRTTVRSSAGVASGLLVSEPTVGDHRPAARTGGAPRISSRRIETAYRSSSQTAASEAIPRISSIRLAASSAAVDPAGTR